MEDLISYIAQAVIERGTKSTTGYSLILDQLNLKSAILDGNEEVPFGCS